METVEIRLDGAVFSLEVAMRTGHRYSAYFFVQARVDGDSIVVRLTQRTEGSSTSMLSERFHTDAMDEILRQLIRNETHEIHQALIQAALREATPTPRSTVA